MVRTKADTAGVKVSGAKAARKTVPSTPTRNISDSDSKNKAYVGGNAYHPRETPGWQKPITTFFGGPSSAPKGSDDSGTAKAHSDISSSEADS